MKKILKLVSCTTLLGTCCISTEGMFLPPEGLNNNNEQPQKVEVDGKTSQEGLNNNNEQPQKVEVDGKTSQEGLNNNNEQLRKTENKPKNSSKKRLTKGKSKKITQSIRRNKKKNEEQPNVNESQTQPPLAVPAPQAQNVNNEQQNVPPPVTPAPQAQNVNNEQQNVSPADNSGIPPPPTFALNPAPETPKLMFNAEALRGIKLKKVAPEDRNDRSGVNVNKVSSNGTSTNTSSGRSTVDYQHPTKNSDFKAQLQAALKQRNIGQSASDFNKPEQNANDPGGTSPTHHSASTPNLNQTVAPTPPPLKVEKVINSPYTMDDYVNFYNSNGGNNPVTVKYNEIEVEANFTNLDFNPRRFVQMFNQESSYPYNVVQDQFIRCLINGNTFTVDQQKLAVFFSDFSMHSLNKNVKAIVQCVNVPTFHDDFINYALSLYNDMSGINLFKNLSKEGQAALLVVFNEYFREEFLVEGMRQYSLWIKRFAPWLALTKTVEWANSKNHTDIAQNVQQIANCIYGRTNEQELRTSFVNAAKATLIFQYIEKSGVNLSEEDMNAIKVFYLNYESDKAWAAKFYSNI